MIKIITLAIVLSITLLTSCANHIDKSSSSEKFESGPWKIDSVAEDNTIKHRLDKDTSSQIFNFREDGVFSVLLVSPSSTNDNVIGTWKVEIDSVFIIGKSGKIAMRFGFTLIEQSLTLKGNFDISYRNKKRPTFFLSKHLNN